MSPAPLFWFRIRKWAQSFLLRLYTIVYVSFLLYTSYFLPLLGPEGTGDMLSPFSDFGFENGLNRLYFVRTWLYTSFLFVHLILFYLPWGGGGRGHATLFWFWIQKWAQSFVLRLYIIVYVFFRLHFLKA